MGATAVEFKCSGVNEIDPTATATGMFRDCQVQTFSDALARLERHTPKSGQSAVAVSCYEAETQGP